MKSGKGQKGKFYRVNDKIKLSPVMVIAQNGDKLGVMPISAAIDEAKNVGLDLVEVAAQARPPVCRIMDFGRFKYELGMKEKKQRKSKKTQIKEVRFRPEIADHDIQTKVNTSKRFLKAGHQVQIKLQFKGRENAHKELGFELIEKIIKLLEENSKVSRPAKLAGSFITCILEPTKQE